MKHQSKGLGALQTPARFRRALVHGGVALGALLLGFDASAQSFLANKKFAPTEVTAGAVTQLTFDLFNSRDETLQATLTDTLPATTPTGQLYFLTTDSGTVTGQSGCTAGSVTFSNFFDSPANTRAQTVTITNAAVPPGLAGSEDPVCQITLPVHAGNVTGDSNVTNTVPAGGATAKVDGGSETYESNPFSASLLIRAPVNPLATTKAFSPANVPAGGESTLTITVKNNALPQQTLNNVSFSDTLPAGLLAAGAPTFSSSCGASPTSTTADDSNTVDMTGATLAAGATCTVTVKVKAGNVNAALVNTIPVGGVTANGGFNNEVAASATLNVRNQVKMTKTFQNGGASGNNSLHTDIQPSPANLHGVAFTTDAATSMVGQPLRMRVYFSNPLASELTGGTLTDSFPAGIVAVGGAVGGTCTWPNPPGAPSVSPNAGSLSLSGFRVPAANLSTGVLGACYVEVWVKATSAFTNNTNALSTSNVSFNEVPSGNIDAATSAKLTATAAGGTGGVGAVTVAKRFYQSNGTNQTGNTPIRVPKGEHFWMRVAVQNTVYDTTYTGGSISDTLPPGLRVASPTNFRILQNPPAGFSNGTSYPLGCGNQSASADATDGAVAVTQVGGQDVITYSGWTLHSGAGPNNQTATNQGCFYAIELVNDTDQTLGGDYINTIGATSVTTTQGATNASSASARVIVRSDLDTSKSFVPDTIGAAGGATTRLTIRFSNTAGSAITGLAVTDNLPSSANFGTLTVANPANLSNTCGGTPTAVPGTAAVSIAGGTVPANDTCQIEVDVLHTGGNGQADSTGIVNTIAKGGVTNDQNQSNNEPVTATLRKGGAGVGVTKSFAQSSALGGRAVKLTLLFNATSASTMAQDLITLTDNLPAGMEVAPTPNIATTCRKNDGSTPADVAVAGNRQAFTISGFRFAPYSGGGTAVPDNRCTLELDVVMTTTGNKTNTIGAREVATNVGTSNPTPTSATLSVVANTAVLKSFEPKRVEIGSASTLTLTIVNVNTEARQSFTLTDNLPAGMTVAGAAATTCGSGTVAAPLGAATVTLTGGSVAANASCTITVPVTVRTVGSFVNDKDNLSGTSYLDTNGAHDTLSSYASTLRGTVFEDPDGNGATTGFSPPTDTGLGGVTVELYKGGVLVATAVTATADLAAGDTFTNTLADGTPVTYTVPAGGLAKGQYLFPDLVGGNDYSVRETQPAGYKSTGNKAGTGAGDVGALTNVTEIIDNIHVAAETNESGYDFGERPVATIAGAVYHDRNDNGSIDAGAEEGIPGVTIELLQGGVVVATTTTDAGGRYSFVDLTPGTYSVREQQPAGWIDGQDSLGTGATGAGTVGSDEFTGVNLQGGDNGINYNFGEKTPTDPALTASIGGKVYHDRNDDGVIDAGEEGISGVTVELWQAGVLVGTTTTGVDGSYAFTNLAPGSYTVREVHPASWVDGQDTAGTGADSAGTVGSDEFTDVVLAGGNHAIDYNFGEKGAVDPAGLASIAGTVYHDQNDDGIQNSGERGIGGVTIQLLQGGAVVATTTTDSDGHYAFTNLAPGTYSVREVHPAGWADGKDTLGTGATGAGTVNQDLFTDVVLSGGDAAIAYNFGERQMAPIPTLSQWGLVMLAMLMAGFAVRRKFRA